MFLIKEIKSKAGELHFRRYRLFWTPWFALYIHKIYKSDADRHLHSHPWNFLSFILSGAYDEEWVKPNNQTSGKCTWTEYDSIRRDTSYYHKITIIQPVTSLVFTWCKAQKWGYLVGDIHWDSNEYRELKNAGLFGK